MVMQVLVATGQQPAPPRPPQVNRQPHLTSLILSSPAAVAAGVPGAQVQLLEGPVQLLPGHEGLHGPAEQVRLRRTPGIDGARRVSVDDRKGVSLPEMPVVLPITVSAADPVRLWADLHALRDAMNPRLWGNARVTAAFSDNSSWFLDFVHEAAARDWQPRMINTTRASVIVRGIAEDPLSYGQPSTITYRAPATGDGEGEFPIEFPWDLAPGDVIGQTNPLVVGGAELTWPLITVVGGSTRIIATRHGPGLIPAQVWQLTPPTALLNGQQVIARHNPVQPGGTHRVEGPDGSEWTRYLDPGWRLWPLRPGVESVSFVAENVTALTAVSCTFAPARRYLI